MDNDLIVMFKGCTCSKVYQAKNGFIKYHCIVRTFFAKMKYYNDKCKTN